MSANDVNPTMYCRGCWYVLDGLAERRCPECGRVFDPGKRRTYRTKPRRQWWTRFVLRTFFVLVGLTLSVAVSVAGWIHWRQTVERKAVAQLEALGFEYAVEEQSCGPPWMTDWIKRCGIDLRAVVLVRTDSATDDDLRHLAGLQKLRVLHLAGSEVTDAGLHHLKGLVGLILLDLDDTLVTDAGLPQLRRLPALERLWLYHDDITDAGLGPLRDFPALKMLVLNGTKATKAGIAALQQAMPNCAIYGPEDLSPRAAE